MKFIHLHCHSEYSLLDGAIRVESLVKKAESLSMPALAITDHGNMFGAIKFYKTALAHGIKPIIGCEFYVCNNIKERQKETLSHITLLAKNRDGYKNLIKLVSISYLTGFYYKPRIDESLLKEYSKGIIALSGCTKGIIPRLILDGRIDEAEKKANEYLNIFGSRNFYLELLNHNMPEEEIIRKGLIEIGKRLSIGLVATNDIHYLERADYPAHDVLICIQTGKKINEEKRLKFQTRELYFKTEDEMKQLFSDCPSSIENTHLIVDACNLELEFGNLYLPHYETGDEEPDEALRRLCMNGLKERYEDDEQAMKRLEYELSVISKMKYAGYFLIIHDLIQYAQKEGIPTGPGRGSVAGSIVAYCLGITDVDPLKYNLLFERFLNPNRVSMPDIDIDFCYKRRDEILSYVTKKYGSDKTAQIITFGTMLARQVLRDTGRVLDFSYTDCDKLAKMLNEELGVTLHEALVKIPSFKEEYKDEKKKELIDIAIRLEGLTRHASTHAAGIVISSLPLTDIVPLYKDPSSGRIATQYSKDDIEAIGLLKMDFLGLVNLTVIHDTIKLIKEKRGIEINIKKIPIDDKKAYELLSNGESIGLFQLESSGMQDLLKRIKPTNFEDLIALLALHRPGPLKSGMVYDFIERKHKRKKIEYSTPLLKPILAQTYGVIVYQEQVMQIAETLAGFSMSAADELRRGMSKKQEDKMRKMRDEFIKGCIKHNHSEHLASSIYDLIARFAEYGFNKSHSAAYALIAYQTSYLKANYPLEFMSSLITNEFSNQDKVASYINECRRMGIAILPPDINSSYPYFAIEDGNIRFSLTAIKHVGELAALSIVNARKKESFSSLSDFCNRVDTRLVNKRVLESLIKAGAFDCLGKRASLILALDKVIETNGKKTNQISLFEEEVKPVDVPEWDEMQKLALEKELTGVYISGHPLERYKNRLLGYGSITSLFDKDDGCFVSIAGMIRKVKKAKTKKGDAMAFMEIEDLTGGIEVVLFPEAYKISENKVVKDTIVIVEGRVDKKTEPKVIADKVLSFDERKPTIHLRLSNLCEDILYKIKEITSSFSGNCPFYLHFGKNKGERVLLAGEKIKLDEGMFANLAEVVGGENVWVE
ncbi:MAG: DNA polymerase III subunit alpha [bacterium]